MPSPAGPPSVFSLGISESYRHALSGLGPLLCSPGQPTICYTPVASKEGKRNTHRTQTVTAEGTSIRDTIKEPVRQHSFKPDQENCICVPCKRAKGPAGGVVLRQLPPHGWMHCWGLRPRQLGKRMGVGEGRWLRHCIPTWSTMV